MRILSIVRQYRLQTAAVLTAAVVVVGALILLLVLAPVDSRASEREVLITSGMDATDVGLLLEDVGVIRNARAFRFIVRITDRQSSLQAGRYVLCPCNSLLSIVRAIASGDALSDDRVITIPEGVNAWELRDLLLEMELDVSGVSYRTLLAGEGTFFPDTYRIAEGEGAVELIDRMSTTFRSRASSFTAEQVIVASMLEKEAKTAEDMAMVAGIMYQRMEIGMALQIDATVGYGWCLRTAGDVRSCDVTQAPIRFELDADGPYNTYTQTGLPAGPISNPGLKALQAAANPTASDYLFYLSTRDGSEIVFSRTNEEHLRNRQKHLGF